MVNYKKGDDKMNKEILQKQILQELIYPKKIPLTAVFADMSPAEFILIASFTAYEKENNGRHITVNELANTINVSVPAVSRTLKNLEERGLIQRVTNQDCRRNTFVIINEKGKKLFESNKEKITYLLDKVMNTFTVDEITSAIKFHNKLDNILNSECCKCNAAE